jgi:hypothetical protein
MCKQENKIECKTAVSLKFPNVRLHLHDLIRQDKQLPSEAMANGAFFFGLISEQAQKEIKTPGQSDMCLCMATAAEIIRHHIKPMPEKEHFQKVKFDEVWAALTRAAETHFTQANADTEHQGEVCIRTHDCYQFAPKLFDLMLQQLLRYPGLG